MREANRNAMNSAAETVTAKPTSERRPGNEKTLFAATNESDAPPPSDADWLLVQVLTSRLPGPQAPGAGTSHVGRLAAQNLPLLSAEEERVLFRRMNYVTFQTAAIRSALSTRNPSPEKRERLEELQQQAAEIRRTLAESNLRLVVSLARKYAPDPHAFEDYVSEALLILLRAIDKFDYARGYRFSTYATHAIRRHFFRVFRKEQTQALRFHATAGDAMAQFAAGTEVLETSEQDAATLYAQLMASAGDRLDEREDAVLHRRFGTGGRFVTQTLREVAADLGISKERVRQIQITALKKLKAAARERNLIPTNG